MSELTLTKPEFSTTRPMQLVELQGVAIGTIEKVTGGFLASNHRKPVATVERAVEQLVEARIRRLDGERQTLTDALKRFREGPALAPTPLSVGDYVEYRRPGVGKYVCEVVDIDLERGASSFCLKAVASPARRHGGLNQRPFWASHRNIRRVVATKALPVTQRAITHG